MRKTRMSWSESYHETSGEHSSALRNISGESVLFEIVLSDDSESDSEDLIRGRGSIFSFSRTLEFNRIMKGDSSGCGSCRGCNCILS